MSILTKCILGNKTNKLITRYSTLCLKCVAGESNSVSFRKCNQIKFQPQILIPDNLSFNLIRFKFDKTKSKKLKKQIEEDEESDVEEDDFDELLDDKSAKLMKVNVNSLRADLLLKSGLGLARNKVEAIFYDSKIRVNGKKLMKKSASLQIGDEVDIVKGPSHLNPNHLIISRIEILSAVPKEENLQVTLRRFKTLTIESYEKNPDRE